MFQLPGRTDSSYHVKHAWEPRKGLRGLVGGVEVQEEILHWEPRGVAQVRTHRGPCDAQNTITAWRFYIFPRVLEFFLVVLKLPCTLNISGNNYTKLPTTILLMAFTEPPFFTRRLPGQPNVESEAERVLSGSV